MTSERKCRDIQTPRVDRIYYKHNNNNIIITHIFLLYAIPLGNNNNSGAYYYTYTTYNAQAFIVGELFILMFGEFRL